MATPVSVFISRLSAPACLVPMAISIVLSISILWSSRKMFVSNVVFQNPAFQFFCQKFLCQFFVSKFLFQNSRFELLLDIISIASSLSILWSSREILVSNFVFQNSALHFFIQNSCVNFLFQISSFKTLVPNLCSNYVIENSRFKVFLAANKMLRSFFCFKISVSKSLFDFLPRIFGPRKELSRRVVYSILYCIRRMF